MISQAEAAELTVVNLRELGRLENIDEARVAAMLGLAAQVDLEPDDAQLWRQYREAVEVLCGPRVEDDGQLARVVEKLSAPLRDEETP